MAQLLECQARDQKVYGPRFNSRTGCAFLRSWERHFTFISHVDQVASIRCNGLAWQKSCIQNLKIFVNLAVFG